MSDAVERAEMEFATVRDEEVPKIGLGTWRLTGEACRRTVSTALDIGYRHVDTAQNYDNEREVGRAIRESGVDREDVFLTTKVSPTNARYEDVLASTTESLQRLGVDYVDLLLLHWPNPVVSTEETMRAFEELREDGKTRHIGVSNFGVRRLRKAQSASRTPLFADQVQFHPYRPQHDVQKYCRQHDMLLVAYSPLGHGGVTNDHVLQVIGRKYGKTPAQVALRWAIQHDNVVPIPKASSRYHLQQNVDVFDFELDETEMALIERPSRLKTGVSWVRGQLGI